MFTKYHLDNVHNVRISRVIGIQMRLLWWKTKPEDSHLWRVKPVFHSWRQSFSSLHGWLTYPLDQVLNVHHSSCPQSCQCIVPLHSTADDVKGRIAKINKLSLHTIPNLVLQTNYIILKVVCLFCLTSAVRLLFVFCVCVCKTWKSSVIRSRSEYWDQYINQFSKFLNFIVSPPFETRSYNIK